MLVLTPLFSHAERLSLPFSLALESTSQPCCFFKCYSVLSFTDGQPELFTGAVQGHQ